MTLGTYCYHNRWESQPGRLLKLTKAQQKPGPTRDISSTGARENQIRNRVMRATANSKKQRYGPLFGKGTFNTLSTCKSTNNRYGTHYKSGGGTGGDIIYWKKIAVGPRSITCAPECSEVTNLKFKGACTKIKNGTCFLGSKSFLSKRRGL